MKTRRHVRLLGAVLILGCLIVLPGPAAHAACHRFDITVDPATVDEGGETTVTVTRDAAVNPSSVEVTSVDESARAGEDYAAVERRVEFTTETEISFPVTTTDDGAAEPAETFKLRLGNPDGCAVRPNFSLGPDATVTIAANDAAAPSTTAAAPSTTAAAPTSTTTTAASPPPTEAGAGDVVTSTSPSTSAPEVTSTTAAPDAEAEDSDSTTVAAAGVVDEDDDGSGPGLAALFAIVAAVLAAGGGVYVLYRRRSAAG